MQSDWYVYILQCGDGSLYTGVTNNLAVRILNHQSGQGAKYTRSHLPVKLVFSEAQADKFAAYRREAEIKNFPRVEKISLIKAHLS